MPFINLNETQKKNIFELNDNFKFKGKIYRYLTGTKDGNTFKARKTIRGKKMTGNDIVFMLRKD